MYEDNPYCEYCGCKMKLLFKEDKDKLPKGLRNPDNEATFEHLYSRLNPKRKEYTPEIKRILLVCRKCNHKFGAEEYKKLSIEEQRLRSSKWGMKKLEKINNGVVVQSVEYLSVTQ